MVLFNQNSQYLKYRCPLCRKSGVGLIESLTQSDLTTTFLSYVVILLLVQWLIMAAPHFSPEIRASIESGHLYGLGSDANHIRSGITVNPHPWTPRILGSHSCVRKATCIASMKASLICFDKEIWVGASLRAHRQRANQSQVCVHINFFSNKLIWNNTFSGESPIKEILTERVKYLIL
jgi:hypothetical protein